MLRGSSVGSDVNPCTCGPAPEDLPVALLSATVDDAALDPALLTVTVDYEAQVWRASALARHVVEWVLDFALRRSERENLSAGRIHDVLHRSVRATFGNGRDRGVPGEILLHAICRQFFGSDTVISKVWFKTAHNDTYKGFDVVHYVHVGNELQLWLGEAKFYRYLTRAIRDAASGVEDHLDRDYLRSEFALIADKIEDDHPHANALRTLMHQNTSLDQVFSRVVVPVFVAYDSPAAGEHVQVGESYRAAIEAEARRAWMRFSRALGPDLPVTVRLFLLPMSTKQALLDALDVELARWR